MKKARKTSTAKQRIKALSCRLAAVEKMLASEHFKRRKTREFMRGRESERYVSASLERQVITLKREAHQIRLLVGTDKEQLMETVRAAGDRAARAEAAMSREYKNGRRDGMNYEKSLHDAAVMESRAAPCRQ